MDNLTYICPNCHRLVHSNKIQPEELINLKDYLEKLNINWKDFYYTK